jgi:hypothetical protein
MKVVNFYFQFLTQNQTANVVRLLECARVVAQTQPLKGRVKLHAQGAVSYSTFSELDSLVKRLREKRFNELDLMLDTSRLHLSGRDSQIESIECNLSVSPTCALWLPSGQWKTDGDRVSDNRYRTAKSHEDALSFHRVSREPSVFGASIALRTELNPGALFEGYADQLVTSLPEALNGLALFGCCDVVDPIFIPQLGRSVAMPQMFHVMMKVKFAAYPELGERFEALHSLMFGSRRVCEGISRALGKNASLIVASHAQDFASVRIAASCDMQRARGLAADWLIGLDKLT